MNATSFVQIHSSVCPECGKIYVSGGTTTTYYTEKQEIIKTGQESGRNVNIFI